MLSEKHDMEEQTVTKCNRLITNLHHEISVLILNLSKPLFAGGGGGVA